MRRLTTLAALLLAAALSLSACASSGIGSRALENVDRQDVTFAQSMVVHNRQAIAMARMAKSRASSSKVKDLAARIRNAQGPQIISMSRWLKAWGKKVPSRSMGGMSGMSGMAMGAASSMPGMVSPAGMKALRKAEGAAFDRLFLQKMIKHHKGAIAMAATEQAKGRFPDALALAKQIDQAQTAEVATMKRLLGS